MSTIRALDEHFKALGERRFIYECHCGFVSSPRRLKVAAEANRLWHIFGRGHILFMQRRRD